MNVSSGVTFMRTVTNIGKFRGANLVVKESPFGGIFKEMKLLKLLVHVTYFLRDIYSYWLFAKIKRRLILGEAFHTNVKNENR